MVKSVAETGQVKLGDEEKKEEVTAECQHKGLMKEGKIQSYRKYQL